MLCGIFAGCSRNEAASTTAPPANNPATTAPPSNGGEDPNSTTPQGSPDVVSQGVTDDTIKIGTISLISGAFAYIGQPAYDGFRACIERLNAQGGVMGRQLEIVAYDDQWDAATGKATVERFVEQDKVFLLASLGGNIVEPSLDYLKEKKIPVINISSGLDVCYSSNDPGGTVFQVQPANMTDARYLIARVLHESIFGPNKDQKLPSDAKIGIVHGTDSASLNSLEYLKSFAEGEGALDRLVMEAVAEGSVYPAAIQKFKNENCQIVIFMGIDATTWISSMDDAQYEVPVVFSYGASTLQSFVPDTYKPGRPCYATVWGDYSGEAGQNMLDDMVDALSYLEDVPEAEQKAYRDNNYCVAGYAYGMTVVDAFERYAKYEGQYGLNWEDFVTLMEIEPFTLGALSFDYMNGKRMGVDQFAFLEYVGDPATKEEKMIALRPFETLEEVAAK
jgi:ABC-type branched-subunit amino acid transport system substrate-binding protein